MGFVRTLTLAMIVLAAATLGTAVTASPATPDRARSQSCGDIPSVIVSDVVATGITCRAARAIARRYAKRVGCYLRGCSVGDYSCHKSYFGYETYHARCTSRGRISAFDYGA